MTIYWNAKRAKEDKKKEGKFFSLSLFYTKSYSLQAFANFQMNIFIQLDTWFLNCPFASLMRSDLLLLPLHPRIAFAMRSTLNILLFLSEKQVKSFENKKHQYCFNCKFSFSLFFLHQFTPILNAIYKLYSFFFLFSLDLD